MSTIQTLRAFVSQRLAAAVEEIFGLLEATISSYEQEIARQRRLLEDGVEPTDARVNQADVRKSIVRKEEQQEWRTGLGREDPEPPRIKEEQEELWSSQEGEQLQGQEEDDAAARFPCTAVSVKSEDDEEEAQASQLRPTQAEEKSEAEPPACSSAGQMETEADSSHQLLSLNCCESETEDSNDDWKETREPESGSDTLKNESTASRNEPHTRERPFSCTVCDKRFGCKGNLHAHMRSHTGEKPFTCTVCNKSFSAKVNLKTHMRSHTGEKPFSCSVCNKSFSQKKTLVIHLRSHTGERPFSCSFCGKRFSEKGTLKRHTRVHTGEKPYSCSACGRHFSLLSHVKSHKCAHMSKVERLRVAVSERLSAAAEDIFGLFERAVAEFEEERSRSKRENERLRKLLDAVLKPEVRLRRAVLSADVQWDPEPPHIKEEQEHLWSSQEGEHPQGPVPVKSEGDEEERARSSQLHQRQTEGSREAEPPACGSAQPMGTESGGEDRGGSAPSRSLDPDGRQPADDNETPETQSDLNTVKLKQTRMGDDRTSDSSEPETENSDDDWKETRKPQSDLKALTNNGVPEGVKEYSAGKKSPSCSGCGKTFAPKDCAQNHMTSPAGEKPFACSVCVPRSTPSSHLVTCKGTHSGGKAFGCSVCKKQFGYKGDAVRHIRTHTGEKPFSCSVCGKRFTQSTGLGTHMRTHTGEKPFSCSVCPKQFIRSGILARHMRVHTGEKPYNCSVCNTRFSLSQSLLKHMRIHTGEKPFGCSVCDKKFTQKGHLTQHMTLHTGEKSFSCRVCGRKFTRQSRVKKHKCVTVSGSSKLNCGAATETRPNLNFSLSS
ncbi:zinc finger protein 271-like [Enoplosus armatus]|uniref:zinc finger protein 271-like n=1 Tax=Enoplosus armatus TaxID=215367 RepID=UPI0039957D5A